MFTSSYSSLQIKSAIDCYDRVKSFRKAAFLTGIAKSTIQRWYNSFHRLILQSNHVKKKARRNRLAIKYPGLTDHIKDLFQESNKLSIFSLKAIQISLKNRHLNEYNDRLPSLSWIHYTLKKAKISRRRFNHVKVCPRSKNEMDLLNESFKKVFDTLHDNEIVCLDETGFSNLSSACYGYFRKGENPEMIHVRSRERSSVIMAIHPEHGIIAGKMQSKAFNQALFLEFLEQHLIPSLPSSTKAILMDNVNFHKTKNVKALFEKHKIIPLYIPPYSPRCNPIEEVFSVLKRIFRGMDPSEKFIDRVSKSIKTLKLYKKIQNHYHHTRSHLANL